MSDKSASSKDPRENSYISQGYYWRDKRILIVEDIATNHMIIDRILRRTKCQTLWAMDGEKAVQAIIDNDDIDLILMDIRLPKMDGYEATRRIREISKNIPIIAQTAYVHDDEIDKVLDVGCNDLITKPINPDILLAKCSKYLYQD